MGPLIPLHWISGGGYPGFQNQAGIPRLRASSPARKACCILGFGYFGNIKYSTVYVNVVFIDTDTVTNPTFCPLCNPGSAR